MAPSLQGRESPTQGHPKPLSSPSLGESLLLNRKELPVLQGPRWEGKHHCHGACMHSQQCVPVLYLQCLLCQLSSQSESSFRHFPGVPVLSLSGWAHLCTHQAVSLAFCSLMNFALEWEDKRHELNMIRSQSRFPFQFSIEHTGERFI